MYNNFFKKYKTNQLQNIEQNYKYIYIFRYNDLKKNEIILIKKKIKNINYKSLILKQNITNNFLLNLKGQGSLLLIYGNSYINLIKDININNFKKIEFLFLKIKKNIYSNLKLKQITNNPNSYLNIILIKSYLNFIYYLRKI